MTGMTGDTRGTQLLRRARSVLTAVGCQSTGCYADTGHQPSCLRGRAEKVVAAIDEHLAERKSAIDLGLLETVEWDALRAHERRKASV